MNVLIDTDPGLGTVGADPEDALAITMALNSPELTVRTITCVHGNVPVEHCWPTSGTYSSCSSAPRSRRRQDTSCRCWLSVVNPSESGSTNTRDARA